VKIPTLALIIQISCGLCYCTICNAEPNPRADHLVTANALFSSDQTSNEVAYRKAIEEKLYVTPGDVARFIQLAGGTNPETVVSIYRVPGVRNRYRITCTQSASSLWETVPRPGMQKIKSRERIGVVRCDADIPAHLASSIHRIWLTMLLGTRPEAVSPGVVYLHGTTELFTAVDADNRELRGQRPHEYPAHGRVAALIKLGFLLEAYCDPPKEGRDVVGRAIERAVSNFTLN
jgi:hypothetical protein